MNHNEASDTALLDWMGKAEPLCIWREPNGLWIIDGDFFVTVSGHTLREALLNAQERMRQGTAYL